MTMQVTQDRRLRRRRVQVMCVKCFDLFRYNYSGTGPYRSVCNHCITKAAKAIRNGRNGRH